jgi:hypothetical protein
MTVTMRVLSRYRPKSYWVKMILKLSQVGFVGGRAGDCARISGRVLNAAKAENRYGVMKTAAITRRSR